MTIKRPTQDQLADIAADRIAMTPEDIVAYTEAALPGVQLYEAVDAMSDNLSPVKYPRTPGYRPEGAKINTTPGTSKCRLTAGPGASWPASGLRSRTAFASPASR